MIRLTTLKTGSTMQVLVPFHALADSPVSHGLLRALKVQNAPAVFIQVNRG